MATNVTSVVSHFPDPEAGFTTTLGSTISGGATTVSLNGTSGLTNGAVFVGIIDPGNAKEQVFTGIVDTGGAQITSVVWTNGDNVSHTAGATIVDYPTATHVAMMTKGLLVEHKQTGAHEDITADSIVVADAGTLEVDTVNEATAANGVTIDGLNIKDSKLVTADSVVTTNITDDAVTAAKLINGNVLRRMGGSATAWGTNGTTGYDVSATDVKVQTGKRAGGGDNTDSVITFPVAFTYTPIILATPFSSGGAYPSWYLVTESATGFTFRSGVNVTSFSWIAIGV